MLREMSRRESERNQVYLDFSTECLKRDIEVLMGFGLPFEVARSLAYYVAMFVRGELTEEELERVFERYGVSVEEFVERSSRCSKEASRS